MATSPRQNRSLLNSPDTIRSSIIRESGWSSSGMNSIPSSSSSGSITSPLRIAKRDSQVLQRDVAVARRSSSSFKHVQQNNLVSKSPFKSQLPVLPTLPRPTSIVLPTRRVSGEKRSRPPSMHEDAETENDRPFSLKRDRKQSTTFRGLLEKEPVTKSPFKQSERTTTINEFLQSTSPSSLPKPTPLPNSAPVSSRHARFSSEPPAPTASSSPGRSSLVSRRLHGPRLSGGTKRERRKTVTFDERCDVVEFDCETSEEELWEGSDDGVRYGGFGQDIDEEDTFFRGGHMDDEPPQSKFQVQPTPNEPIQDDPYENTHLPDIGGGVKTAPKTFLDSDASITGLVEEMFFSSNTALVGVGAPETPTPNISDIPTDLETEDGIPFEQMHQPERLSHHLHQDSPRENSFRFSPHTSPHSSFTYTHQSPQVEKSSNIHSFSSQISSSASPHGLSATLSHSSPILAQSTPPISRRLNMDYEEEKQEIPVKLSPSPMRTSPLPTRGDSIPKYMWPRGVHLFYVHQVLIDS